jgi:hypothetical protein
LLGLTVVVSVFSADAVELTAKIDSIAAKAALRFTPNMLEGPCACTRAANSRTHAI